MNWMIGFLVALLMYIGFDYGRLMLKNRRLQQSVFEFEDYTPIRYIMIGATHGKYIGELATLDVKAHTSAGIGIKEYVEDTEHGYVKTVFENKDELIVYDYDKAQITALTQKELNDYAHKLFFDYKLPEGAERAIIKQLGLIGYMVNIGICSEKSGGK